MLLLRSPSLTSAFLFASLSILLTILTFQTAHLHPQNHIQFLIILPPLNSIFLFLLTLTWIERRFRLSYIPLICLIVLFTSSLTLTIISSRYFSTKSYVIYSNFLFYSISTIVFFSIIFILIFFYFSGLCSIYYSRHFPTDVHRSIDQFHFQSTDTELFVYTSVLSNEHICNDIQPILRDLTELQIDTILSLNESQEYTIRHSSRKNFPHHLDNYSSHVKRANIRHLIYPIREHFIPRSISDYMQFLSTIILNITRQNYTHLFVHSMKCFGRNAMTIVCLDLLFESLMKTMEKKQTFWERMLHYPFCFSNSCRVCQSIVNIRKIRSNSQLNPLQIYFLHEFYARLKSASYMAQIREIITTNEKLLLDTLEDLQ